MQITLNELGNFKRSVQLEIPLEDIKSSYNSVYNQLRRTRMKGFRPGKFPKGWLDRRFKEYMAVEAQERVIPRYVNQIVQEHQIIPASQVAIKELDFDRKEPLKAVLEFEVRPKLEPPDYTKLKVEVQEPAAVSDQDVEDALLQIREGHAQYREKPEDAVAEMGDQASFRYSISIDGEILEEDSMAIRLSSEKPEGEPVNLFQELFVPRLLGMKVAETKPDEITLPENYPDHAGKTAQVSLELNQLGRMELPELDDEFIRDTFGLNEPDQFQATIREDITHRRTLEVRRAYQEQIDDQLQQMYGSFELPESPQLQVREQVAEELAKQEELSEEERAQKAAEIEQQRLQSIRRLYILDTINLEEKVTVDSNQVISEFMNTAQMFGLDPKQLIESPLGKSIYENIRQRNYEAQVLDRVTARVLGEPISTSEEVHDHNHAHDHDHNHG